MESLTTEQMHELLEIINEEFGTEMQQDEFADALHSLLEDIPGFETTSQRTINQLTTQLWSQYHE